VSELDKGAASLVSGAGVAGGFGGFGGGSAGADLTRRRALSTAATTGPAFTQRAIFIVPFTPLRLDKHSR
jgi:hypothetical protein